tara:strand:- start:3484 stop:4299 length:816 start_codon:yes stop_codon:yes gene_type:complete
MKNIFIIVIVCFFGFSQCKKNESAPLISKELKKESHKKIIDKYVINGAKKYNYKFQMAEWQNKLDEGLKIDSTVAYLWQQKAMPYFKARKYEVGMKYLDKAVFYNPERWLSYRAFIKCIFAKTYKAAILDFEKCIDSEGNGYVMDHTYNFHIALSYLQLNEFEKAEKIFSIDIENQKKEWVDAHFLDLFYFGISKYEQGKWEEAIKEFDSVLSQYPNFSDVEFYKTICLKRLGRVEEAKKLMIKAKKDGLMGNTIFEDNSIYETYPYQVRW